MTMAAAVVAHALAALKHHFIDRDVTLKRMLPL
jgi:cytochrome b561